MEKLNLNTYIYGPKDDFKHRKNWREKYNEAEKKLLSELINEAKIHSINFVYSISPGLDMVMSSAADERFLKEKLLQVKELGCQSFAIFFDDIPPELCLADKTEFRSFGEAHALIINKMSLSLEDAKILMMCPTEYCSTRAKPNVQSSEYLQTLGDLLNKDIHIMWTGQKVISENIPVKSIDTLTKVLQRKPIIWDNIHANDYDQRRVFLGPYKGRPLDLYNHISGVLTNPNCEYECNFVAIHSLSSWVEVSSYNNNCGKFDPETSLNNAVADWLKLLNEKREKFIPAKESDLNMAYHLDPVLESMDYGSFEEPEESIIGNVTLLTPLSNSDVLLLCHMFYLPYEHGKNGLKIIKDFKWLKANAVDYSKPIITEHVKNWNEKVLLFKELCQTVNDMYEKFIRIPNQRALQQLHPYIYDAKESVNILFRFVRWLESEKRKENLEGFLPSDPEPWFIRGGITQEIQNLLPTRKDACSLATVQLLRPYIPLDKDVIYRLCLELDNLTEVYPNFKDLPCDSECGVYLELAPENVFVIEYDDVICGYCAAFGDASNLYMNIKNKWLPMIRENYPRPSTNPKTWSIEEEAINRLYSPVEFPASLFENKGIFILKLQYLDINIGAKLLKLVSSRFKGKSLLTKLTSKQDETYREFYKQLGCTQVLMKDLPSDITWYQWIPP